MKLKKNSGLTLVEILLAITILVLAIIPLMKMLGDTIRGAQTFSDISIATQLAQDLMEEIKSKKWDETTPDDGGPAANGSAIGLDPPGEPPRDDIDDYNGYSDTIDNKFTRSASVIYVNVPDSGAITLAPGTTDHFKRITITVEWPGHTTAPTTEEPLVITTVRANYRRY